jgi:hypothetical protein
MARYSLHIKISEFLMQCFYYYSKKYDTTYQNIATEAFAEFMKQKLTKKEYEDILDFVQKKKESFQKLDDEIHQEWMDYYNSLPKERIDFLDRILDKCYEMKIPEKKHLPLLSDVPEIDKLNEIEQRQLLLILSESWRLYHKKTDMDMDAWAKALDNIAQLKEEKKKKNDAEK